jgi:hypothetical protein
MPIRQDRNGDQLTPELMAAFAQTVSMPRWQTYLKAAGFRQNVAISLYLWNVSMGQSFHFPLQVVEVALRNVIHGALTRRIGLDWWSSAAGRQFLDPERCQEIDRVAQRIRRKYEIEPHADQVVASLTFGFWAALLNRRYDAELWDHETDASFPHLNGKTIKSVSGTADAIQALRNRVFHHEPLIGRPLSDNYSLILRLLGWICPVTREWVRQNSSVPVVLRERPR